MMLHVPMMFHEILFVYLEIVVLTMKKAYLSSISDLDGRNLKVVCDSLVMMHASMKFPRKKAYLTFDLY